MDELGQLIGQLIGCLKVKIDCFHPGLNWGSSACKSDVINATLWEPAEYITVHKWINVHTLNTKSRGM